MCEQNARSVWQALSASVSFSSSYAGAGTQRIFLEDPVYQKNSTNKVNVFEFEIPAWAPLGLHLDDQYHTAHTVSHSLAL